nr:DUF1109 domain-containing protein [Rhizobium sp. 16-449-1b]
MIDALVKDLRAVHPSEIKRKLLLALAVGFLVSAISFMIVRGFRPDLVSIIQLRIFWLKSAFPFVLSAIGTHALLIVARPGGVPLRAVWYAIAAYLVLVALALLQLKASAVSEWSGLMLGRSWWICPMLIVCVSAPVFAAIVFFLRQAAPTDLRLSGFVAGSTSGAIGAWIYSWGCLEDGLAFMAMWYLLGILACGALGALSGPRLLRW